jgi:thiamine pyrophosphokinase
MSHAVILANGVPPSRETLERAVQSAACFVCADGGANVARAWGLKPEAIVGDLDSATPETLSAFTAGGVRVMRDPDTERTDTEKAIQYVLSGRAYDEIVVFGATAGRLDHVVGHLSLLKKFAHHARIVLEDDHGRAWLASGNVKLDYPPQTIVSFFAVGEPAEGVTTENLSYPLTDRRLGMGALDSISNMVTARPAQIRIRKGDLLVVVIHRP